MYFLCLRRCADKYDEVVKLRSQIVHLYGRSPVCFLIWTFKEEDCVKFLQQISHENGFSPKQEYNYKQYKNKVK